MANRKQLRPYKKDLYNARGLVQNFFHKLEQFRAIAMRYDKAVRKFISAPARRRNHLPQLLRSPN